MKRGHVSATVFVCTMVFLYLPLSVLIVYSFNAGRSMSWSGFSLEWYQKLFFESRDLWHAFGNSVIIALASSLFSTILGTLAAIGINWYTFKTKRYLQITSFLPLILPEIIIGVSLLIFFAGIGLKLSLFTIFIAHTTFNIPFVLLIVLARLEEFDYSIIEAAYDLGAAEIQVLLRVIVPMSIPAILAGFLTAVTLSLEDFVITFFVAGPGSSTLPLYVFSTIRYGVSPVINSLSVVMITATALLALSTKNIYRYIISSR